MTPAERGFFPLDSQLGLVERNWSEGIVREAVWLCGQTESYEQAAAVLERIGKLSISDSTLWRQVEKRGEALRQAEQSRQQEAMALPKMGAAPPPATASVERMGVGMDGALVHIREEGWKELKVGCVFEVAQRPTFDKETQEWREIAQAVDNTYVAHLGGPEYFGQLLWAEAQERGWEEAQHTQTIGDGAKWIWNLADEHFFLSQRTVDWYHATQYLHETAQLLYPDTPRAATRWYNEAETLLFQGQAETIAAQIEKKIEQNPDLPAEELTTQATYFHANHKRMQYMTLREEGFPIGSGMIESGAKQFKARFNGPGMRWSRDGLSRLLPIRAAVLSDSFDSLWNAVFSPAPN